MTTRKTLKYRLYRNKNNRHLIRRIEIAAHVWNHSVALTRRYYRRYGKHLGANQLKKHITKLKRQRRLAHWKQLDAQAIQDVAERLDRSYQRFFADPKVGRPSFKKRKRYTSFTLKQTGWKLLGGNRLRIMGRVYKFAKSREVEGVVKTVTIKRDRCGDLWLCFSVIQDVAKPEMRDVTSPLGFDFGLKTFLTSSDGSTYHAPQPFKASLKEMARLQRSLARKERGSNRRRKARLKVARLHRRIADQRRDWHFKLAHELCDRAGVLCFEDLSMKGMQALWGRKVGDLGFAGFVQILEHVAGKRGVRVVKVDRFYPSTKTCSACGEVSSFGLDVRRWRCEGCGGVHDRDHNAAVNILREGASSLGLGDVSRVLDGVPSTAAVAA